MDKLVVWTKKKNKCFFWGWSVIFSAIVTTFMFICFFTIAIFLLHKTLFFFKWELQGEKYLENFQKKIQKNFQKKISIFFFLKGSWSLQIFSLRFSSCTLWWHPITKFFITRATLYDEDVIFYNLGWLQFRKPRDAFLGPRGDIEYLNDFSIAPCFRTKRHTLKPGSSITEKLFSVVCSFPCFQGVPVNSSLT